MTTEFIVNHLWQSSCFALLAGVLAFVLRRNPPKVRYWIWVGASVKFLMPWALLVSLGSAVLPPDHRIVSAEEPPIPSTLVKIAQPFAADFYIHSSASSPMRWIPVTIGIVWAIGFVAIAAVRCRSWRSLQRSLRAGTPVELPIGVPALLAPGAEEPGIVGFLRPVLLLPASLLDRLNPRELEAVLAHEWSHVRRGDNLSAAVHMAVEALFWFDPLVWWIGARMVEERELACDEEVLRMGCDPTDYAQAILRVCRFCAEPPLPCVSAVTGADVKKRIRAILAGNTGCELTAARKAILTAFGLAIVALPVVFGVLDSPRIRAQSPAVGPPQFEVASIRLSKHPAPGGDVDVTPGRFRGKDLAVQWLILVAYRIRSGDLSGNLPNWTISERYDIDAKTGDASDEGRILLALQGLLQERFQLRLHREMKEEAVYFLTTAKNGIKMPPGSCVPAKQDLPNECYSAQTRGAIQTLDWRGVRISDPTGVAYRTLVWYFPGVGRPVIDRTGLAGTYDIHLRWSRDPAPPAAGSPDDTAAPAPPADPSAPSIFDAVQEQLGLKLTPGRGFVEHTVVDRVEKPSEN